MEVVYPSESAVEGVGGRTVSYAYDEVGNRAAMTNDLGTTAYTYDNLNRLESILDHNGQLTQFEYDAIGRRRKLTLPTGSTADYSYDDANRLLSVTYKRSDTTVIQSFSYTYDDVGNVLTMTEAGGTVTYTYDAANQVKTAAYPDATTEEFDYDPAGNRLRWKERDGTGTLYTYDLADRLLQGGNTQYTYDSNGNLLSRDDGVTQKSYVYDFENRLKRLNESGFSYNTHLDPGWNFFSLPGHPVDTDIASVLEGIHFPSDVEQISRQVPGTAYFEHYVGISKFDQFGDFEFGRGYEVYVTNPSGVDLNLTDLNTYDDLVSLEEGWNLIGAPGEDPVGVDEGLNHLVFGTDYSEVARYNGTGYDRFSAGELTTLDPAVAYFLRMNGPNVWEVSTSTQSTAEYVYNGDGERVRKVVNGVVTNYYYDFGHAIFETDQNDSITRSYVHGPRIDEVIYQRTGSSDVYFLRDRLGSTRGLLDNAESLVDTMDYTAFGKKTSGGSLTEFQYTGRRFDSETGLYYYRNRYYSSELARFMTQDPIGFAGGLNLYRYVNNNPLRFIDPFGLILKSLAKKVLEKQIKKIPVKKIRDIAEKIFDSDIPLNPLEDFFDPQELNEDEFADIEENKGSEDNEEQEEEDSNDGKEE